MAKKIKFDVHNNIEPFTLILSTREYTFLGKIHNADLDNLICKLNLNSADEISFTVYHELNNYIEPLWDKIQNFMIVYVQDLDEYYQIVIDKDHSDDLHKEVHGFSLCEAELSQTIIYGMEVNNSNDENVMNAKDGERNYTIFYDFENPELSLLHRILKKAPHYTIKHVDASLAHEQRMFSFNGKSIYDIFTKDCAEQFNCLFQFNSRDRSISVYDLYTVCQNDNCSFYQTEGRHYRGPFNDYCPKCGSTNIYYYGTDTHVFVDRDNLTNEVKLTTDTDSIKNTLRLEAGDANVTAAIRNSNPNGSNYITYFSPEMKDLMPDELVEKLEAYDNLYESKREEYEQLTQDLYEAIDEEYYLEHSMMPKRVVPSSTAAEEAEKLNNESLSGCAINKLSDLTTKSIVDNAVLGMAKVIIRGGYYKVEIKESSYSYGNGSGTWVGKFTVTSYADNKDEITSEGVIHKKDSADTGDITVIITDDYENYLNQKIYKQLAQDTTRAIDKTLYEVTTFNVLENGEISQAKLNDFRTLLHGNGLPRTDPYYVPGYNLTSLKSFDDAFESCIEVMVSEGHSRPKNDNVDDRFYYEIYLPIFEKKQITQQEIVIRNGELNAVLATEETLEKQRTAIQELLNFQNFLGEDLYLVYCAYRREDTYSNSNFTSEGLTTQEIFENVEDFLEKANKEMIKAGTPQHTLTANLYNLLVMKEFSMIVDEFELGNWIRARIDNQIYRLRLIGYEINFKDLSNLNTTFSNLTITADGYNDVMSILSQAKGMATSYGYVQQQAKKGNDAENTLYDFRQIGLDSALYKIKNANTEEIVIDNHGLTACNYDDISDDYGDEQVKITHNIIAFTNDNWKTVKSAIGKLEYRLDNELYEDYGLNVETLVGARFIGGDIYSGNYSESDNYGTHFDLLHGDFSLAGGRIKYDTNTQTVTFKDVTLNWETVNTGDLIIDEENVDGLSDTLGDMQTDIDTAQSTASGASSATNTLRSAIQGALLGNAATTITANSIISPKIGGGYLYITGNGGSVEINPQLKSGSVDGHAFTGNIFTIMNPDGNAVVAVDNAGNANFTGTITGSKFSTGNFTSATSTVVNIEDSHINLFDNGSFTKIQPNYISFSNGLTRYSTTLKNCELYMNDTSGPVNTKITNSEIVLNYGASSTCKITADQITLDNVRVATINDIPDTSKYVTRDTMTLTYYYTKSQIDTRGFLESDDLDGYATQYWCTNTKNFATQSWVTNKGYLTSVSNSDLPNTTNKDLSGSNYVRAVGLYVGTSSSYRCIKHVSSRIAFQDSAGNYTDIAMNDCYANSSDSYKSRSSKYIKKNINNIAESDALNILNLRPVEFDYIDNNKHSAGLIAEETEKYFPQLVYTPDNYDEEKVKNGDLSNVKGISYLSFIPYIIKLCQVQQDEIDILKAQILDIKGEKHG